MGTKKLYAGGRLLCNPMQILILCRCLNFNWINPNWVVPGVPQNEIYQTWSCYISLNSSFDTEFGFFICFTLFSFLVLREEPKVGCDRGLPQNLFHQTWSSYIIAKHISYWFWILNLFHLFMIFAPRAGATEFEHGAMSTLTIYVLYALR